jgi:hypothetical protein
VSLTPTFRAAMAADKKSVERDAVSGDKTNEEFKRNWDTVVRMRSQAAITQWITEKLGALGVNVKDLTKILETETAALKGLNVVDINRMYVRIISALSTRNVRWFMDELVGGDTRKGQSLMMGPLAAFSDLIGSLTRNKVLGHRYGAGHTDAYYRNLHENDGMEIFANLVSLYGGETYKGWAQIFDVFTPQLNKVFRSLQ